MRTTHALPMPWPTGRESGTQNWGLVLPKEAIARVAKRVAIVATALLLSPLAVVLALIFVLTTWPAWILTAPVLGTAWLAEQMKR